MDIKDVELENTYQTMPPLTDDEYQELKEDIQKHGVRVPIIFDSEGRCIDGHHRLRICKELNLECFPSQTEYRLSEQEKIDLSRTLNMVRRHLTQEQKQKILKDQLTETPEKSDRQIGEQLGVDHKTVGAARKKMESIGEIPQCDRQTSDGREYPSQRKQPETPVPEDDQAEDDVDPTDDQAEEADDQEEVTNEDTDVEDAGLGDDEDHGEEDHGEDDEAYEPPACCQGIHNGFQGLFGLIDIEVRKLHESGKFDLYSGDVILELQNGIDELRTRLSDVQNGRSKI